MPDSVQRTCSMAPGNNPGEIVIQTGTGLEVDG